MVRQNQGRLTSCRAKSEPGQWPSMESQTLATHHLQSQRAYVSWLNRKPGISVTHKLKSRNCLVGLLEDEPKIAVAHQLQCAWRSYQRTWMARRTATHILVAKTPCNQADKPEYRVNKNMH